MELMRKAKAKKKKKREKIEKKRKAEKKNGFSFASEINKTLTTACSGFAETSVEQRYMK